MFEYLTLNMQILTLCRCGGRSGAWLEEYEMRVRDQRSMSQQDIVLERMECAWGFNNSRRQGAIHLNNIY